MESVGLYPKEDLINEELIELVTNLGGYSTGEYDTVLTQGRAAIFIDYSNTMSDYEEEEVQEIADKLGKVPQVLISVHIGHGKGSRALCMSFAKIILDKWGGILDNNFGELFTKEELFEREREGKDFWDWPSAEGI